MTAKEAKGLVAKHGNAAAAARSVGMAKSTFHDVLAGKSTAGAKATGATATVKTGKSLSDFRAQYDKSYIVPRRVQDGLKRLGAGWEMEVAFAKLAGVSLTDLGNVRDLFAAYWVPLSGADRGRRAWFGNKANADTAREMIG